MSALPQRTRTLVKDFFFKEKFGLTSTQTDIMAYLINIASWAKCVGDGFYLILTRKIENDLSLKIKTIEASLLKLKKLNLIEITQVNVDEWSSGRKFRAIKITNRGNTYNNSYKKVEIQDEISALHKKIEKLEKNLEYTTKNLENTAKKLGEYENSKNRGNKDITHNVDIELLNDFKQEITDKFKNTTEPICNNVDGWEKETEIYINNYNKISAMTKNQEYKQVDNPIDILKFWKWLYENQHRIGDIQKFKEKPEISKLLKYIGLTLIINQQILASLITP